MSKKELIPQIKNKETKELSRLQKLFNSRVKKVKNYKERLEKQEAFVEKYQLKIRAHIFPVQEKLVQKRIEYVKELDKNYSLKYFRKTEKEKIKGIILDECHELIQGFGVHELEEMYDKYSEVSYEETEQLSKDMAKDMAKDLFENMFGVDMDELEDIHDEEEVGNFFEKKLNNMGGQHNKKKEKTKAQVKKEEKMKKEAENISKTARAIYTDLVKELHPDREQNEEEKSRKTEVMKQVTKAYKQDDLFELLKLQLEYLKSAEDLDTLPEERLKYYTKILLEQMKELEQKYYSLKHFPPPLGLVLNGTTKQAEANLKTGVEEIEFELEELEDLVSVIQTDKKNLRAYLKNISVDEGEFGFDEFDFFLG